MTGTTHITGGPGGRIGPGYPRVHAFALLSQSGLGVLLLQM